MKKMLLVATFFMASMMLTSCSNSPEKLVSQYEKACQAGDINKAGKILEKMEKLGEDKFTSSQEMRISKANAKLMDYTMEKTFY